MANARQPQWCLLFRGRDMGAIEGTEFLGPDTRLAQVVWEMSPSLTYHSNALKG